MAITLYDVSVGTYVQIVGAARAVLEKGHAYLRENNIDPASIVDTRLAPDMLPFRFQVQSIANHSLGSIAALKTGKVGLPAGPAPEHDYSGLQALLDKTEAGLKALTPAEVNACEGGEVLFETRDFKMRFTAANYVLSFCLPNLLFHATTAYDILRLKGVPVGKRDFMGALRLTG